MAPAAPTWITTAQVAEGTGVHVSTILRWGRLDLLPKPTVHHGGRRGRVARWPAHTIEQALWVKQRLEAGFGFDEIAAMLEAGEFVPSGSGGGSS